MRASDKDGGVSKELAAERTQVRKVLLQRRP